MGFKSIMLCCATEICLLSAGAHSGEKRGTSHALCEHYSTAAHETTLPPIRLETPCISKKARVLAVTYCQSVRTLIHSLTSMHSPSATTSRHQWPLPADHAHHLQFTIKCGSLH